MGPEDRTRLLEQVIREFDRRGLLEREVTLESAGRRYRVLCDSQCLSVFRVNPSPHIPPGLPGWAVCRISLSGCYTLDEGETVCLWDQEEALTAAAELWVGRVLAWMAAHPDPSTPDQG